MNQHLRYLRWVKTRLAIAAVQADWFGAWLIAIARGSAPERLTNAYFLGWPAVSGLDFQG